MTTGGIVQFYLKSDKIDPAAEIGEVEGRQILKRLRQAGRKVVDIYALEADGKIDRYQERTRRKLGSNAIASRTWLCETAEGEEWANGRYVPEPIEAIDETEPTPLAVVLVLSGAESMPETIVEQLQGLPIG
ncbi:MAG TPA: hypothetical protein PLR44_07605 [Thermomicrobiales bacterium]|nr:hypothetical protein [Thermomicrobiales bacterium]HRA31468.1 hypothetical protein [Thermomicrobiales bacterium]